MRQKWAQHEHCKTMSPLRATYGRPMRTWVHHVPNMNPNENGVLFASTIFMNKIKPASTPSKCKTRYLKHFELGSRFKFRRVQKCYSNNIDFVIVRLLGNGCYAQVVPKFRLLSNGWTRWHW